MTLDWIHPGLLLILGAWALLLLKGLVKCLAILLLPAVAGSSFALLDRSIRVAMLLLPAAALTICLRMTPGTYGEVSFLGQDLVFGRVDELSLIFSYVFSIMAFLGMVYAFHVQDDAQHVTALTYAGGALGVTFAGDFLSLYVFWELMAISSALLVWQRRDPSAVAAGFRYLLVHVFGGLILLAGILLHWSETGSPRDPSKKSSSGRPTCRAVTHPLKLRTAFTQTTPLPFSPAIGNGQPFLNQNLPHYDQQQFD